MDGRCRFTGARSVAEIFLRRRLNVTAAAHGVCEHLRRRGVEKRWRRGYYFLFHPSDAVDSNANGFVITSTQNARSEKLLYRSLAGPGAGKQTRPKSLANSILPACRGSHFSRVGAALFTPSSNSPCQDGAAPDSKRS
jgi:hypothetical protein